MFKAARWRAEKNKIKAVFKFQFQAFQLPQPRWEEIMVSVVPAGSGKPAAKSEKAATAAMTAATVEAGSFRWPNPIYETVKFIMDPKTGKISEKFYQFVVSATGRTQDSVKSGVLGEVTINLADYAEAFKPRAVSLNLKEPNSGTILHVTVQRVQGDAEGRETDEEGDAGMKHQRRTLRSQLSNSEFEEGKWVENGVNDIKTTEERIKFPSSRTVTVKVESNRNMCKLSSSDAISGSGSDCSSGYTANENKNKNSINHQDLSSLLSPLCSTNTSIISAPYGSIDGLTFSLGEVLQIEASQEPDNLLEKLNADVIDLRRQLEVSELELQTLRKQVVRESKRGQDLSREIESLKEERDALGRECEDLKASKKRLADEEDPWSMLDEAKKELNHEKNLNANMHSQLQKTEESKTELIQVIRDMEQQLDQKNKEISSLKADIKNYLKVKELKIRLTNDEDKKYSFDALMDAGDAKITYSSQDHKIADINTEIELYRKHSEELEIQMEQLALDYEILKQEKHEISKKLEQIQLREQLRMQYECSAHFAAISDLETQVEDMEKELQRQEEAFQVDLAIVNAAKVEQVKRAIQAEEALRKARLNNSSAAQKLQEEFKRLNAQMSSAFFMNEKLVMQIIKECGDLRLQKCHLEEMLEKTNEEFEFERHEHRLKCQQLLILIDFKTKEADRLLQELKEKRKEIENIRLSEKERAKDSLKEISRLEGEIEKLLRENNALSQQINHKKQLTAEMDQLKETMGESQTWMQDCSKERSLLDREGNLLKEEVNKSQQELNEFTQIKIGNVVRNLNSEIEMHREDSGNFKHSIFEDELEKENLQKPTLLLREETGMTTVIEKKLKDRNAKLTNLDT